MTTKKSSIGTKAFVTGGGGFIGSNVVEGLLAAGYEVVAYDNFSSGYQSNLDSLDGVCVVNGDIRDGDAVLEASAACSVFFHLAASVGNKRSIDDPCYDASVNVIGSLNVLEAARRHGAECVVASSSAGVYGELRTIPISESHVLDPDTPYGSSKLCMEKNCIAYERLYGLRTVCLRYFNVYGRRQRFDEYGNVIPIFADRLAAGKSIRIYGDGEQTRDFVNVKDVVQANLRAGLESEATGVFNVGSSTRITINRLAELLEKYFAVDARRAYEPPRPGDVLHSLADIGSARSEFGFEPAVEIELGLAEYVQWYKNEPSLT